MGAIKVTNLSAVTSGGSLYIGIPSADAARASVEESYGKGFIRLQKGAMMLLTQYRQNPDGSVMAVLVPISVPPYDHPRTTPELTLRVERISSVEDDPAMCELWTNFTGSGSIVLPALPKLRP